jgi:hypothetical protein
MCPPWFFVGRFNDNLLSSQHVGEERIVVTYLWWSYDQTLLTVVRLFGFDFSFSSAYEVAEAGGGGPSSVGAATSR